MPQVIAHYRKSDGQSQSLEAHLIGVASRARSHAQKIGLPDQGELLGILHDLGKYSEEFQAYLKSAVGLLNQDEDEEFVDAAVLRGKVDHSTAGAQLVWRELSQQGPLGSIVGQMLSLCVASHHSGMIDCLSSDANSLGEDVFGRRMSKSDSRSHLAETLAKADASILSRVNDLKSRPNLLQGLQTAISRIVQSAPNKDDKGTVAQQQIGLLVRFLFSALVDADRIDTADFENPAAGRLRAQGRYCDWSALGERLERHLAGLEVRLPIDHLRRDISDRCLDAAQRAKGIHTLTVPTGGGKTLASLRFALHHAKKHGMDRVIFVIPFTSIIDQNAEVVRGILEPEGTASGSVVLEHHSNLTPERQSWRGKILSESWDAPVVFTTSVQFLEALFGAGTRGARRMHQLANAVVIFDEIQTLPVSCVHLFNNAINFLVEQCGATAVLCTATQPLLGRVDSSKGALRVPKDGEIMPHVKQLFDDLKRVEVHNRRKPGGWSMEEIAELALVESVRAGSCLVIVNTKSAAQSLHRLCSVQDRVPTYHLSTSMCPAHRKTVLVEVRRLLDEQRMVLCISTQLIEAGVDVDFGAVIRFTAGLDSIAQAAGRCNRSGRRAIGHVHVVNPTDETLGMLPDIRIGRDLAEWIMTDYEENPGRFGDNLIGPEAMTSYHEKYFFARQDQMDFPVAAHTLGHDDSLLNLLSGNSEAVKEHRRCFDDRGPSIYLRQSFMAAARAFRAIDAPTRGIIVPYSERGQAVINELCAAYLPDREIQLLRQAQQFTVNVFPHVLNRLMEARAAREVQEGTGILFLDSRYYSSEFGLSEIAVDTMETLDA